jgi:thiol-disulfide isomerase/thioredoxin
VEGFADSVHISDTATFYWLGQELGYHKGGQMKLITPYVKACYNLEKDANDAHIVKAMAFLLDEKTITDERYEKAINIYSKILGKQATADSLTAIALKRYPQGLMARKAAFKHLADSNLDTTLARNERFLQMFPPEKFPAAEGVIQFGEVDYNKVYQTIIIISSITQKFEPLYKYAPICNYGALINLFYKVVEIPYDAKKTMNAATAEPLADCIWKNLEKYRHTPDPQVGVYSPDTWRDKVFGPNLTRSMIVYIDILMARGRNKEALEYASFAQHYANYSLAALNEEYIKLLSLNGRSAEVPAALVASLSLNQATTWMLEQAKEAYVKEKGTVDGFDEYVSSLTSDVVKEKLKDKLKEEIRNEAIADFTMLDMNGKSVKLSALKGKVVVLDFWATWCAPCKASFPGMDLARRRYENDKNVVFYFVDTQETTANYKKEVKEYLAAHKFPFNVLFDNGDATKHKMGQVYEQYSKAFHTSGIPKKLIIGPNGKLKFLTDGYKGSPSELADEVSAMIEIAKKS